VEKERGKYIVCDNSNLEGPCRGNLACNNSTSAKDKHRKRDGTGIQQGSPIEKKLATRETILKYSETAL